MRRIDLLGVDEVADGEMKMAWVDGTDQVLVINISGEITAVQGVCSHEYFELDKGFLTNGTLTCALHLSRFDLDQWRAARPAGRGAAGRLSRGGRGRPHHDRGPGRPAGDQRVLGRRRLGAGQDGPPDAVMHNSAAGEDFRGAMQRSAAFAAGMATGSSRRTSRRHDGAAECADAHRDR